ncbi:uncharacterized protein LOC124441156 isoform X2 [Xenia sp. Carnegie-2017]|uniref:uncharacterized protein LOC124441156 isoform X2 n=1 Tax=Xenia sp. Carnegie-2017 TaxID=2897299 RepID=UPI001F03D999|nr:uncharacterized protein LOC124441156 isoform X2 [Xenia sp. Carnegie-2017]
MMMFVAIILLSIFCPSVLSVDLVWNRVSMNDHVQPRGCYKAQSWVDNKEQLWLFGGVTYTSKNGSNVLKYVHDLWRFELKFHKWQKMDYKHLSNSPTFIDKGLTSYCLGDAYIFGHILHKKNERLWLYNMSSNIWKYLHYPRNNTGYSCVAMWCNETLTVIKLLCLKQNIIKLWHYGIVTKNWSLHMSTLLTKSVKNSHLLFLSSKYVWSYPGLLSASKLLIVKNNVFSVLQVNKTGKEFFATRKGFVRWIDRMGNLNLLGGKVSRYAASNYSSDHWMLNMSNHIWVKIMSKSVKPRARFGACVWYVKDQLWLFSGYRKDSKGHIVIERDLWKGRIVYPQADIHSKTKASEDNLPGDTLKLSLINKLIISMATLCIVMVISIRLCYKRELYQVLSKMSKQRVVYHQVSQEGEKNNRL